MNSDKDLRTNLNKLLDFFTEPGGGEKHLIDLEDDIMQLISERDTKRDAYIIGDDINISNFAEDSKDAILAAGYNDAKFHARQRAKEWREQ